MKIAITGNPGVGKHTSGKLVAKATGAEIIDINKIALSSGIAGDETEKGLDVDVFQLASVVAELLQKQDKSIVIGHLAPYVLKRSQVEMVAVLRRSPYELVPTLQKRGYPEAKVKENAASEILGITYYDAIKTFGKRKVAEVDTTGKTPAWTAEQILSLIPPKSAGRLKRSSAPAVDWLGLVSERGEVQKFFDYATEV